MACAQTEVMVDSLCKTGNMSSLQNQGQTEHQGLKSHLKDSTAAALKSQSAITQCFLFSTIILKTVHQGCLYD